MPRSLDVDMKAQVEGTAPIIIYLAEMDFAEGITRANSSPYTIQFNGQSWIGTGVFGGISVIQESTDLRANGLKLQLSGIDPALVAIALASQYKGRTARLYLATLDPVTHLILGTPLQIFRGRMDNMPIEAGDKATITVNVENRLIDWERPRIRRYTNEDQQSVYPGDKGLEFVNQMVEKEIVWPSR